MRDPEDGERSGADLKVRAAWLYYVEGLTQEQVALHLGVSRLKVLRMLAAGREEGVVRITIEGATAAQVRLERQLERSFGLDGAVVVPSPSNPADAPRMVGYAVARAIGAAMHDGASVGVGWGATLQASLAFLTRRPTSNAAVVSLLGGLIRAQAVNPSLFAWRIAEAFGADSFQLTAPVHVADAELRDRLWREPELRLLKDRAKRLDVAFVSVGDMTENATVFRHGILPRAEIATLRRAGAVADVLVQFIDAEGRPVDHPLNRRVMAIELETIRATPKVVLVAGSTANPAAIRAGIRATRARVLITDEAAARGLVEGG